MDTYFDLIHQAGATLLIEANTITDSPPVYADAGEMTSGGNFCAGPMASATDMLALAIAEIGAPSERRIALLIDSTLSGLPPFLVRRPGLDLGFMTAHVTATAPIPENKTSAHPASVDSLLTSANQKDCASMATFTGRRLQDITENTATIVGAEALTAAQGIDFHKPLTTSDTLQKAHGCIRTCVAYCGEDCLFALGIETARHLVLSGNLGGSCRAYVGELALV